MQSANVIVKQGNSIGLFTIVYAGIVLGKLFGIIDWSWFWILFPFILIAAIIFAAVMIAYVIPETYYLTQKLIRKYR